NLSGTPNNVPALEFGETAINLTAAGVFPPGTCENFGSAFVKSRASASFSAEVKDFIAPIPVNVSNCGTINITKVTQERKATIDYTTIGGLSPSSFDLMGGQTQSYSSTVQPGNYSVNEPNPLPAGWTFVDLTCTHSGNGTTSSTSGATASITMAAEGEVDCTYTNHTNASPKVTTTASGPVTVGATIHDTAHLSGGVNPTGTISFQVFAPGDANCTTPIAVPPDATVNGNGDYTSGDFTTTATGTYRWIASYSGDANNNPFSTKCNDAGESSTVTPAGPNVPPTAPSFPTRRSSDLDTAHLSGGVNPTGTISFQVFAPGDANCTTPI